MIAREDVNNALRASAVKSGDPLTAGGILCWRHTLKNQRKGAFTPKTGFIIVLL